MAPAGPALLLLIDLQVAFCDDAGSMARQGRDIGGPRRAAAACGRLAAAAREGSVPVVWTRMVFREDYSDGGRLTSDIRPNLARVGALRRGSGDERLSSLVSPGPGEAVVDKPRFSALYGTPLEPILRAAGIGHVVVAGVTTSMCVESTVRDLGQRDYYTTVVAEACADFAPGPHEASLAAMEFGFARIASLDEAGRVLAGGGIG